MFFFDCLLQQEDTDFLIDLSEVNVQSTSPSITELYHNILCSMRFYIFDDWQIDLGCIWCRISLMLIINTNRRVSKYTLSILLMIHARKRRKTIIMITQTVILFGKWDLTYIWYTSIYMLWPVYCRILGYTSIL